MDETRGALKAQIWKRETKLDAGTPQA